MDLTATVVPWDEKTAIILTLRDATERRQMREQLLVAATYDDLTGLFNRRYLMGQLAADISAVKRHRFPLSLSVCGVDELTAVNDAYGHGAGDDVLAVFGSLLQESLRTEDFAGRYSGDEFCIVFPHVAAAQAFHSVERIRKQLEQIVFDARGGATFSVSATFGIADLASEETDCGSLLEAAGASLLRAKVAGGNRTAVNGDPVT